MLLAFVAGVALALPPALLGPDGPTWLGPEPPVDGASRAIVVDPKTGGLWLEEQDALGQIRAWEADHWTVGGVPLAETTTIGGLRYLVDQERLVVVEAPGSGRRVFHYDEGGRLNLVRWPNGTAMSVHYDAQGRVGRVDGPGPARWTFSWGEQLVVRDLLGRTIVVQEVPAGEQGERAVEVRDTLGRRARTWYVGDRLVAWEDPRGHRSRLSRGADGLQIVDPVGRRWVIETDELGQLEQVILPSGGRWRYERDGEGRLIRLQDPAGRSIRYHRDDQGRIEGVARGGSMVRLTPDAAGRVVRITTPSGAATDLVRDEAGRVVLVRDAKGGEIHISRFGNGLPMAIVDRTGARWALAFDLYGRVDRVVDPSGRVVHLERDSSGRLVRVVDERHGAVGIARGAGGAITVITTTDGRETGFVRDGVGRVSSLRLADGTAITLERDAAGDISKVRYGDDAFEVERDAVGRPLRAGEASWSLDADGRVDGLAHGGLPLRLLRDKSGLIEGARNERWHVRVRRDATGLPVSWEGTDGPLAVTRDANRLVSEVSGAARQRIVRDPVGNIDRIDLLDGPEGQAPAWRFGRDAVGRALRVQGPGSLAVGVDRDLAGRVTLIRYPDGAMLQRSYEGALIHEVAQDSGGRVLSQRSIAVGPRGEPLWTQEGEESRIAYRYDPLHRLVAVEQDEAALWSWSPEQVDGPGGVVLVFDESGHLSEARPPPGPPAWGVGEAVLTLARDTRGRLERVSGDLGTLSLSHDGLDRLANLWGASGVWSIDYDAVGRPQRIRDPDGVATTLLWGGLTTEEPGMIGELTDALAPWISLGGKPLAFTRAGEHVSIVPREGDPGWLLSSLPVEQRTTPMGFPNTAAGGPAGAGGTIQVFAGGPLLDGVTAFDPVSGQRTDGIQAPAWTGHGARGRASRDHLDPAAWASEGPWHDPLQLLVDLGELEPAEGRDWMPWGPAPTALPWLPGSLDGWRPPPGPRIEALPLSLDPITERVVASALPGGRAMEANDVIAVVLAGEQVALDLPAGLELPGVAALLGFRAPEAL